MEQLKDKIVEIENEVRYYDEQQFLDCCDYWEQIDTLLKLRKKIIDRYVIDNIDKFIDKICEFDERLTDAFRANFESMQKVKEVATNVHGKNKQIESNLFLQEELGEKPFWRYFNCFSSEDDSYSILGVGCAKSFRAKPEKYSEAPKTFDETIRAAKEVRELFMNRPLSASFYYLFEETYFSLMDLIGVWNFYCWTTIRVMSEYTTHKIERYGNKKYWWWTGIYKI